mmetsp:Transcript_21300/g.58580  ORF Transcript_21300/g.58580 Transcript_21300/m.58580 type:complete len:515 (+) Transcript_21300:72-1616(+)|eukprot:scaffold172205_cov33-Tisochrysis_lutea.AAC.2
MDLRASASAPGKLILFGEHAVVYGHTAVAAALSSMRVLVDVCLAPAVFEEDDLLEATLHDLPSASADRPVHVCLRFSQLSRAMGAHTAIGEVSKWRSPCPPDSVAIAQFGELLGELAESDRIALVPLLFLVASLLPQLVAMEPDRFRGKLTIDVRSAGLPVGAGLGSSAAFSVALSAALLRLQLQLSASASNASSPCAEGVSSEVASLASCDAAPPIVLHDGASQVPSLEPSSIAKELINKWAYYAECILHGTPSGLDNSVSCSGGGMRLSKPKGGSDGGSDRAGVLSFSPIASLPEITVLLTNTRVPRSTRELVARVRRLHESQTAITQPIFSAIAAIAQTFLDLCEKHVANGASCSSGTVTPEMVCAETENDPRTSLATKLPMLVRANHGLLVSLGVSGVELDDVVSTSASEGLATKLTGAGGGGCALSIVGVGKITVAAAAAASRAKRKLEAKGYECYMTAVGGSGVLWHTPTNKPAFVDYRTHKSGNFPFAVATAVLALATLVCVRTVWK